VGMAFLGAEGKLTRFGDFGRAADWLLARPEVKPQLPAHASAGPAQAALPTQAASPAQAAPPTQAAPAGQAATPAPAPAGGRRRPEPGPGSRRSLKPVCYWSANTRAGVIGAAA